MNTPAPLQTEQVVHATPSFAMLRTLGLVAGLSGFLVVLAYQVTYPMIEENKRIAIERALFNVIPGAVTRQDFMIVRQSLKPAGESTETGTRLYAGFDQQGRLAGVALEAEPVPLQDHGRGVVLRAERGMDTDHPALLEEVADHAFHRFGGVSVAPMVRIDVIPDPRGAALPPRLERNDPVARRVGVIGTGR